MQAEFRGASGTAIASLLTKKIVMSNRILQEV
jgi:hypothetical protein